MVTEKTRSLFVVYRFYLAYNTVNFILKMFANSRFQFDLKSRAKSQATCQSQAPVWGAKVDINTNCKKKFSNLQIYVLNSRFLF